MKPRLVLIDDPSENELTDLARVLSGRGPCKLTVIVEPIPRALETDSKPEAGDSEIAQASAVTAGAPVARLQYKVVLATGKNGGSALEVTDAVPELLRLEPAPRVIVAFVTNGTLPLLEALHAEPRTQPLLKIGVTGPRLDTDYNLAQKLFWDKKIHYHEHSFAIDRVLNLRIATMLRAHEARPRPTAKTPEAA